MSSLWYIYETLQTVIYTVLSILTNNLCPLQWTKFDCWVSGGYKTLPKQAGLYTHSYLQNHGECQHRASVVTVLPLSFSLWEELSHDIIVIQEKSFQRLSNKCSSLGLPVMLFTYNTSLTASFNEKFLWLPAELSKDLRIACVFTTRDLTFIPLPELTGKSFMGDTSNSLWPIIIIFLMSKVAIFLVWN